MEFIPKNRILQHHPDTLMSIRKEYNLDKPGAMRDAINILREWVEKQQHFTKKDFNNYFLEATIIACKGSIERAKRQIDRMCTLITLLPNFFEVVNIKTDLAYMFEAIIPVTLPKLTADHYRVFVVKATKNIHLIKDYLCYFIHNIILSQYIKTHDYCCGFYIIADFTEANVMDFLPNQNPVLIRQGMSILIEGFGMRIKGFHIFSSSKLIESFVTIMKQVTSPKVSNRIYTHKSLDILPSILPLDILPEDYGGTERPLKTLLDEWIDELSSEEHIEYIKTVNRAGTDESCRQVDKFNDQYAGTPGTFRILSVD